MTDFHSHILPGIDDGCQNTEESIAVLKEMGKQGITRVVATPHYSANGELSPLEYLEKRKRAEEELFSKVEGISNIPEIICGAEVKYFQGISGVEEVSKLKIGNTELLLLEMPFCEWSNSVIAEVKSLYEKIGVIPLLAHIERFLSFQKRKDLIYELKDSDILIQANAEFILGTFSSHKAIKMIKNREIDLLGSDTHNMADRKPNLGLAIEKVRKKAGQEYIDRFERIENTYAPW